QRTNAVVELLDIFEELALIPDVVAVCDDVAAREAELLGDGARQAVSAGGVLAVAHDEVVPTLATQLRQQPRDRLPSGLTDDIADGENAHLGTLAASRIRHPRGHGKRQERTSFLARSCVTSLGCYLA